MLSQKVKKRIARKKVIRFLCRNRKYRENRRAWKIWCANHIRKVVPKLVPLDMQGIQPLIYDPAPLIFTSRLFFGET